MTVDQSAKAPRGLAKSAARRAAKKTARAFSRWRGIIVVLLLPTVSRERAVADARNAGMCAVIEPAYHAPDPSSVRPIPVSEFTVITVPDVLLVGSAGLPILKNGRILTEPVASPSGRLNVRAVERTIHEIGVLRLFFVVLKRRYAREVSCVRLRTAVHLIPRAAPTPGGAQYAHWYTENAAQIDAVERLRRDLPSDLVYVINAQITPFQEELLARFGVDKADLRPHSRLFTHVESLVVATLRNGHSRNSEYDPKALRRVRDRLTHSPRRTAPRSEPDGRKLVALLRVGERKRIITNISVVTEVLFEFGADLVPNVASLQEDLTQVRQCRVMVGAHGAGLVKMLFCPRLEHVVELMPPGESPPDLYQRMAAALGVEYHRILGENPLQRSRLDKNADFAVPANELRSLLTELGCDPASAPG